MVGEIPEGTSDIDILNQDESATGDSEDEKTTLEGGEEKEEVEDEELEEAEDEGEEDEEESDEEEELEDEEEDEELEEAEDHLPNRKSFKDFLKDHPTLRKDPEFREIYFREKAYTEVFPTVEDAKEAGTRVIYFTRLGQTLMEGNPFYLLNEIALSDANAATKLVHNFLPTIAKNNQQLYIEVARPVIRNALAYVLNDAVGSGNKDMETSVKNISLKLFGSHDLPDLPDYTKDREPSPEEKQLQQERQRFEMEKMRSFDGALQSRGQKVLSNQINKIIGDPKERGLSPYLHRRIIADAIAEYDQTIQRDPQYKRHINRLWKQAKANGMDSSYRSKILSAYLGRDRLLPSIVKRILAEVKGEKLEVSKSDKGVKKSAKGKAPESLNPKKIDWSNTNDRDILDGNITYKE